MPERYEYKVVEVRERMIGGKMSGDKLEKLLNDHASQGWQLKAITSADVKGRVGPGGPRACLSPSSAVSDRAITSGQNAVAAGHPQPAVTASCRRCGRLGSGDLGVARDQTAVCRAGNTGCELLDQCPG